MIPSETSSEMDRMLEGLTAPLGSVDLSWDDDTLHWVRWRLAHDFHHRFHAPIGVEVRADFFEPLDGDLYSLPVWSPACRRPTYFGRLSPGAVRVSDEEDAEFLSPGFRDARRGTRDLSLEGKTWPNWRSLLDAAVVRLRLRRDRFDHALCQHRVDHYPLAWDVALLVRTAHDVHGGRVMVAQEAAFAGWLGRNAPLVLRHGERRSITLGRYGQPAVAITPEVELVTRATVIDGLKQVPSGDPFELAQLAEELIAREE